MHSLLTIYDWTTLVRGHESEWISGLTGALGAVLGSVTGVLWSEVSNRRRQALERRERLRLAAFGVLNKLNSIYSSAVQIKRHLDRGLVDSVVQGKPFVTLAVTPMVGRAKTIEFTMDELWGVTQIGGSTFLNDVGSTDDMFNGIHASLDRYDTDRRTALTMFVPTSWEGQQGSVGLSEEEFRKLMPHLVELDSLIIGLVPRAEDLYFKSLRALESFATFPNHPLGRFFGITVPDLFGEERTFGARRSSLREFLRAWSA